MCICMCVCVCVQTCMRETACMSVAAREGRENCYELPKATKMMRKTGKYDQSYAWRNENIA